MYSALHFALASHAACIRLGMHIKQHGHASTHAAAMLPSPSLAGGDLQAQETPWEWAAGLLDDRKRQLVRAVVSGPAWMPAGSLTLGLATPIS
jgi:hypothetical protein